MDGTPQSKPGGGGGGGGPGPAPFLLKTYDMVDDSVTDEIVSWTSNRNSFVVWNPPEFARLLLPTYFKHNNFSSFIRQLNTYGFRKIDPERWEFANEDFVKDQRYLLKNIHRRKPIHSHSNPPVDPERTAFLEEIEKLTQEKTALEKSVSSYKQQQLPTKLQLEDLIRRVDDMELRQDNLLTSLKKSVQNPGFVDLLAQKLESMDFSAYNKKRRLPPEDNSHMVPDDSFLDNHSPSRPDFGNIFHHDFANKLRLELSNMNMVSHSTQSSNEEGGSPQIRLSEGSIRDALMTPGGIPVGPDQLELSDTGTSITFNMDSSFVHKTGPCEIPSLNGDEDAEGRISCRLNLSLASSTPASQSSGRMPQSVFEEIGKPSDWIYNNRNNESDPLATNNQVVATGQAPVNDGFWEQFLTERPGSSDATTIYRQENQRTGHGLYQNSMNLQNLTL